jgi:hypothetical protein
MAEIAFREGAKGNEECVMFPATVDGEPITCNMQNIVRGFGESVRRPDPQRAWAPEGFPGQSSSH